MPVHVEKRSGSRPYKIVETATGKVVGSSTNKKDANIAANAYQYLNETKHTGGKSNDD